MKKKILFNKKGQIQGSIGAVVALIIGVGVATLVMIFVGVLGGQTYNIAEDDIDEIGLQTVTADSDTFIALNGTAVSLDQDDIDSTSLVVTNTSNDVTIGNGNFTIDATNGQLTLLTNTYNNSNMTANYDYWDDRTIQNSIKTGITSSFEALEQTGNYLPLIVLAIVISLILGLVLGFTSLTGGSGGSSAL